MKRVSIKEEFCTGCGLCEVYCLVQHSESKNLLKAHLRETPRSISRTKVEEDKPYAFSLQCRHCEDPLCVIGCLSGAMQLDKDTGFVKHDDEKCIGCWTCIMLCPYNAIRIDSDRQIVVKCDLCPELDIPACVANCPNEALVCLEG